MRSCYPNFNCKKWPGQRSHIMNKIRLPKVHTVALILWFAACGQARAQVDKTSTPRNQGTHTPISCTTDSQCPSGQRCGFTGGDCNKKGKCVVPSKDGHCIDPGGRCGCDGRPVDIFCGVGSNTEFTSAPVNAVGPCPRPCTENQDCRPGLSCQKGLCVKP